METTPEIFAETISMIEKAIAIPSVSGNEKAVLDFFFEQFAAWGWPAERHPVEDNRYNIFVPFGVPKIVFTTHVDVVPAPPQLFHPRTENGNLIGRGSCDAKGIACAMISACRMLLKSGTNNFGLLLVVGEERDQVGARAAAKQLLGRGIEAIVNGEPTERKIVLEHKGCLGVRIECTGRSAHSGYPEKGEDANAKIIRIASKLLETDFGVDPSLGPATVNVGYFGGGVAANVISPSAFLECIVRVVGSVESAAEKVRTVVGADGVIKETSRIPAARMEAIPGFPTCVVSYVTDVPNFFPLTKRCVLFGPGTIDVAHTDHEHIALKDLELSIIDYQKIFAALAG